MNEKPTTLPAALPQPGDLVTEIEAASILGLAVGTLRNWRASQGQSGASLPFKKIGRRAVRYLRADIADFIAGKVQAA